MNKIFKVIWCKSSQVWIAVSELSKVKAISSTSTENKPTSSHSNFIKTIAISLPIATIPSIANAVIGIDTITNGYAYNTGTAVAEQVDSNTTWAYDYKNPGNKSYYDANSPSNRTDGYSSLNQAAYGIAIGRYTNAQNRTQASNGVAIGDYARATGGLATSIGAFSQAEDLGSTAIGTASRAKGFNSLAMMRQSAAIGDYSAAIGSVAYAKGQASFAFGASATANGNQSIAIGNSAPRTIPGAAEAGNEAQRTKYDGLNNTQTNGERSVAIGSGAQTNGNDSFAFGSLAKTGSFYQGKDGYLGENVTRTADAAEKAIAFGTSAMATGNASVAFGYNALGGETNAIAFGVESKAHKADSIAFGSNSNATQANSIAFGSNAQALHENVITIGKDSKATKKGAMTIGESAQSNANNSLALGNGTIINQEDIKNPNAKYTNDSFDIENGVVAIANKGKERRLVNLAAGREDTDAVNVKQLTEVNDNLAKSIAGDNYNGYSIDGNGRYSYKAPDFNIKNQTLHNVKDAVELAQTNYVSVNADKTKQTDADSNYDNLGAKAAGSIALGEFTGTSATATDSVAIGHNTKVNGQNTVAIGANITAATNGSVILGDSSKADGSHATETVASKEIDGHTYTFAGKAKDAGRFVSVGEKGDERQIKNVAAGHVETDSTDAINGSQLYAVASHVAQGLNFQGDNTDVTVNRQLGETLNINGGANKNNLSDNNIGVVGEGSSSTSNGGLTVKLAKDLKGLNSVETKEIKLGDNNSNTTIKYEGDRIKYGDKTVANLDDEKHIKPGEYTVDNNGDVTMTYVDGNNKDVANEKAVIKGIAKNDLSNINKAGETKIQNLAKDAIDMENGENTVASHRDVNGVKTFKVDVKGDLANITSITGGANTGKVEFAGDQVVNVAGDNPIKLDAKTGDITGLTNKTLDGADFGTKGRAATEEQLKIVNDSKIGDNNIRLAGNSGKTADQKLSKQDGIEFNVVGGDNAKYVTTTAAGANVTVDLTQDTKDKIDNAANQDLSNITNEGKKVITGLGTIVEAADSSVTVTNSTDAVGRTTYKVKANVPGADAFNIKYKANGANDQTVALTEGLDFTDGNFTTASVAANGVVKYDVKTGEIENGANGKDGKPGVKGTDGLATVKTVVEAINNSGWLANATKSTGELDGTSTATKVKPGAVVNFDAGKNLKVKQTLNGDDHTYTYSLDSNLTNLDKVVVNGKDGVDGKDGVTITGPNGAKGEDGKVGITGKDGKDAVSIAGKDGVGHIGLTGPKGADGSDGKSVDISTNDGTQTLVNQEPGTDKSQRIVYTPKDKDGNPIKGADGKDIVREVATMDDGLKFKGDDSTVIAKKLNEQLDIIGGADKDKLTDNNIGVNSKDGKLNVQLSKDIDLTNDGSIKFGDNTLNINKDGLTINNGPSITKDGIDGGNKQIKNVQEGTDDNDVVTVKQLKGSKTIIENGKNTTVTGTGSTADPYKVNVEGALKDITSITNKDGNGKVEFAGDQVVNVAGDNSIKLDAKTGDITGLTNKTIDGSDFATKGRAATEEQLKATGDQVTNNLTKKGLNFGTQSTEVIHKNLGEKLEIVGEGTEADDRYDATNIKTMTKDGKVVIGLAKDLTADKVTVGQKGEPGKDGVDGQIGVNGKDGSAVVLNGKDGSIGLNGENGKNGVSIKGDQGPAGVDGAAGETKNRIVYEYKDPNDPNKTIKEDVATLNDGLKFKGDKGDSIAKKLNEELEILGKLDPNAAVTDKNLRVDNDAGKLVLKMAKQLQDLTSATFIDETTGNKSVIDGNGLTVTPKDADNTKTVSVTDKGLNNGGNQIVNVDSGLKKADGTKVELKDAEGDTLNNAVNVGDLKESISNITDSGFGLTDENGKDVKAKLGETVTVKGDGSVTTKVIEEDGKAKLQVGLNKDVTIGNGKEPGTITVKGENGKDGISINGKDGTIGLKGEDGKDGIALNGKDGTIGINGKDGSNGKITVAQGQAGLDGNDGKDGKTKTRIVYEKPNGDKEEVATLNDGLKFTGNNEVVNSHKLNSLVTIKGEGVDKAASDAFKSAAGNVNVKADGKATLEVQLAKDLKNIDSISNKDGQKIEFKDGGTTISGGNVSVDGNNITNVKAGKDDTDAVNVKQLKDGIAQATTKVAAGKNVNVTSAKNPDGSTTYTVATKDDVDFTSVTTGKTTMNDGGITIKATEGGKTNVTLTNKGLDNGGNKVVNVAEGTNDTDAVNVKQLKAAKTEVEAGDNVVVTSTKGSNGQTIYKVNATDNSAHVDGSDAVTVTKAPTTRKNGTTTVTDYKVDLSNKTKGDINKGVDAHDTVNNKGLTFNADKGTTGVKKLGSQVAVNGDNKNIETVADANGVKVKLKDDISVNSVTAKTIKAGDTTINDNGLTIKNGPSVTKDGINAGGSRITNVAPGRDGTDAVNVNQLKKATNEIHNSLNKMDKRRKAGTASALAAAGLMQAYREGQSSVTAGVGQYQNQSAVAVGYSRLSDNGKYGVKVSFTTNTQGEVGGTASAGYFW